MTMLDSMRRHKGWLKWSLGIVGVTFVWFYVPSFFRTEGTAATDTLATVDGRQVLVGAYQRLYQQQVQSLRASAGGSFDEQLIRQLNIPQRIIAQMIDSEAVIAEALRLGITVSDAELAERIVRLPGFTDKGHFIGDERYRQLLKMQRPPITPAQFEAEMREQLIAEKLQAVITGWVRVSDTDVDEEYRQRNEKVKLDLAVFTATQFRSTIQPTEADLAAQFAANTANYTVPEKRRVRFLSVSADTLRVRMAATTQEIEARYQSSLQNFSTPEQIRSSHILFKTEGKDDAAVKKVAESVLARVKAGGDFAALAKQYSDDTSKDAGGDLDYSPRGKMVKEFDDVAWALKVGQTSDLVKSQYGYHIIKLTERKAAAQKTLAEVRPQLDDQIRYEKAQAEVIKLGDAIAGEIKVPADLDKVARARGMTVGDSGLFARDEPLAGLGFAPEVSGQAFTMKVNEVSARLQTNQGLAFIALTEIAPAHPPKLEEVKDRVREDVVRLKAVDVAKAKAAAMAQAAKGNFAAAAKAAGVTVKPTTDFVTRGSAYPEVGVSAAIDAAVFALKAGETTAPITTESAVVVARVKERQSIDAAKAATERDSLRNELLQQHRETFFRAYMSKVKKRLNDQNLIKYEERAIRALLGGS